MMEKTRDEKLPDEVLVARLRQGDAAAFDLFVDRYFGMVFSLARARVSTREAAEDLAQEVFLRVFLHLEKLKEPRHLSAWLTRITRNLAMDWERRESRRRRTVEYLGLDALPGGDVPDDSEGVVDKMQCQERDRLVEAAMERLPVEQREVLLLYHGQKMSKKEIAETLQVHPSTVGRQIEKAEMALRDRVLEDLREVRPSRGARVRTAGALAAAAALTASERTALAASAPVVSAPAAVIPWYSPISLFAAAVVALLGVAGVYRMSGSRAKDPTAATIARVEAIASGIHSYRYVLEGETYIDGEQWDLHEKGVFLDDQHYAMERKLTSDVRSKGEIRFECRIVRNASGLLDAYRTVETNGRWERRSFSPAEIEAGLLPAPFEQRPRFMDPFCDMERSSLLLAEAEEGVYLFRGMTKPILGRSRRIVMQFDAANGLLRAVYSEDAGNGELATLRVTTLELNPAIDPREFDIPP
jgi:RNA polymerase sigma-70 factor (ECF subfamily)